MNDVIKLLPDSVANQIAAGEVIQRPASVVKELVENAVDAGAKSVKIILRDAGRTLIQVVDDGSGMSGTDARLAFERHSTSKITCAADMFKLTTMGFRGEALASIAAVAQVELRTMRRGDTLGTRILISGSRVESQDPDACTPGSNMMVKNLFFNVPARRKFLKKDSVELSAIVHEFERLALVNPGIELTLIHNDTVMHQLMPGNLKQRIGQLFGKTVERSMLPVETNTSIVKISGFVGLPDSARRRNWLQYFFVNGRNMRHPYFHKAVMHCYENLIAGDAQPNYFISFDVDPESIDVNIHPTKNEIKFVEEQSIWQILEASVKESLGKFNVAPAMDFSDDNTIDIPAFNPQDSLASFLDVTDESYNPFEQTASPSRPAATEPRSSSVRPSALNWKADTSATFGDWDKLYSQWKDTDTSSPASTLSPDSGSISSNINTPQDSNLFGQDTAMLAEGTSVMQFKNRYILSPARSGLMVIDQHRAHVKVLYERNIKSLSATTIASQSLIFPEIVRLSGSLDVIMSDIVDSLTPLGFDIASMGHGNWAVNGVPALAGECNPVELVTEIVTTLAEETGNAADGLLSGVALSMARKMAVQGGQTMTTEDMEHLMNELFSLPSPNYTPDGKKIINIIDTDTLISPLK